MKFSDKLINYKMERINHILLSILFFVSLYNYFIIIRVSIYKFSMCIYYSNYVFENKRDPFINEELFQLCVFFWLLIVALISVGLIIFKKD